MLRFRSPVPHSFGKIANTLSIPKSSVVDVCKRYEDRGNIENHYEGRPGKKISEQGSRALARMVKSSALNRRSTLATITNNWNEGRCPSDTVSTSTMRRTLKDLNLRNRIAVKKPFVNARQALARRLFAKKHAGKTEEWWSSIIWSDEASFELNKTGRVRVWRAPGEQARQDCLAPTFKSGRISVMVWGCFVGPIKGPLVIIESGRMNSLDYMELLSDNLVLWLLTHDGKGIFGDATWTFQQDNAPIHSSRATIRFLNDHEIPTLPWPAQSPDLNPIENVWSWMKQRVAKEQYSGKNELITALRKTWDAIPSCYLEKLVRSMPHRIASVKSRKGLSTKY